jgi:hypothetical protein
MVLSNPGDWRGRLLAGWAAADIDECEALEETAIVERLRRFGLDENSHAGCISTGHASGSFGGAICGSANPFR